VIILADDLGHGDLGVTGAPDIRTPNIDGLAAEGVRFTHAYANAPVCSPTRAALLSWQYQQRTGVDRVIYATERDRGMALQNRLLPSFLKEAGYATGIIGKWHLGYPREHFPTRFGFDEFVGFVVGNIDYLSHTDRLENHDIWRGEKEFFDERYFTGLIADEAIDFIDRHAEERFFLYLPFNAPHDPFQGPEHRSTAGDQQVTRKVNRTRAVFRSMVESMDSNIGRVLEKLDAAGIGNETVVFFMSDNGSLPVVARNEPFRGHKTTLWEGGIRTPLIARWRDVFPQGGTVDEMAIGMDLFATALDLAGVTPAENRPMDGVSLLPVLERTGGIDREALYFRYQRPRGPLQKAVIHNGWKYLSDNASVEHLFDLAQDPGEQNDLAAAEAARFRELREKWVAWEEEVLRGAPPLPPYRVE
jgi:arylsulfatase A